MTSLEKSGKKVWEDKGTKPWGEKKGDLAAEGWAVLQEVTIMVGYAEHVHLLGSVFRYSIREGIKHHYYVYAL